MTTFHHPKKYIIPPSIRELQLLSTVLPSGLIVPNPVTTNTEIGFFLPEDTKATVTLINKLGQEYLIADGEYTSGYHSVNLERENLQSGMYFYRLTARGKNGEQLFSEMRKMILMR